jgi:hypothetical protein
MGKYLSRFMIFHGSVIMAGFPAFSFYRQLLDCGVEALQLLIHEFVMRGRL